MSQCNLHQHSDGSLLDGSVGVREIVEHASSLGQQAIAITDHNECNQHMAFGKVCAEFGLHPVYGMEGDWIYDIQWTRDNLHYPSNRSHICLLAENNQGLHNLWALSTLAYQDENRYYKPLITPKMMVDYREGIYASDGCMITEMARAVQKGDEALAKQHFSFLHEIYQDHFYCELHTWQFLKPSEEKIKFFGELISTRQANQLMTDLNQAKIRFANQFDVPLVVVNDSHYAREEQWMQKELVWKFSTTNRNKGDDQDSEEGEKALQKADWLMGDGELYKWMDKHQVADSIVDEAIKNASEIASKCHATITRTLDMPRLGKSEEDDFRDLVKAVEAGFKDKVSKEGLPEEIYDHRLRQELSLIRDKGFAGYFRVEKDLIDATVSGKWASKGSPQPMLVGPGRGSGGGSLVNYLLGITSLDPIHYDLLFERFLAPGRKDWPDIDTDFPQSMRPGAKEYLEHRHHKDCVCTIGTLGRSGPKAILRDLCRALKIEGAHTDKMARIIDQVKAIDVEVAEAGEGQDTLTWEEVLEKKGGELAEWRREYPELFTKINEMHGIIRNSSRHASGVVVSNKPLLGHIPLRVKSGQQVTQLDMYEVEELGAVKLDLLGLRHLDTLMYARNLIYERLGHWLDYRCDKLPWDLRNAYVHPPSITDEVIEFDYDRLADKRIWSEIAAGHTLGIFQIETPELSRMSQILQPQNEKDVAALISIVRPGVKDAKLDQVYLGRRNGTLEVEYDHPMMEPITRDTYGVMIYQEQLLRAVQELAGFTPDEADDLRKALGKKKMEKVVAFRQKFIEGCQQNDDFAAAAPDKKTGRIIAQRIWGSIEASGRYAFNKSHAVGYAIIATWEIWTKHHYPLEYMTALLATDNENINRYVREARRMGINILPPDVNISNMHFTPGPVGSNTIRYGLSAIKGVAGECSKEILARRGERPFKDVVDLATRCDSKKVAKGRIEALISIGALDEMEYNEAWDGDYRPFCRTRLMMQYHDHRIVSRSAPSTQAKLAKDGFLRAQHIEAWRKKHGGKPAFEAEFRILAFECDRVVYEIEQELVGNYVLIDPLEKYMDELQGRVIDEPTDLDKYKPKDKLFIGGMLEQVKPATVKKKGRYQGREMAFLLITWNELDFDVTVFPDTWDVNKNFLQAGFPVCCTVERDNQSCHLVAVKRLDLSNS